MSDLTKGVEFSNNEQVTATKLNNLVDNATINAGAVGSDELAVDAVTTDKVQDGAITRDKLAEDAMGIKSIQRFNGVAAGDPNVGDRSVTIDLNTQGNTVNFSKTSVSGVFSDVWESVNRAVFKELDVNPSNQTIKITWTTSDENAAYYYLELVEFY